MNLAELDNYNFIFHIGFPKCGSTFLQNRFLNQHTNFEGVTSANLKLIAESFQDEFNVNRFRECLMQCIHNPADKTVIVSHELFMIPRLDDVELLERFKGHLSLFNLTIPDKPDSEKPYYNLKLGAPNSKILLVLRNQFDVIMSEYVHRVREDVFPWSDLTQIDRFFEETYQSKLYDQTIELLIHIFGKGNVLVVPFEWIKTNPEEFVSRIEAFTSLTFSRSKFEVQNKGEYNMARLMQKKYTSRIANIKNTNFFINQRISDFLYYRVISKPLVTRVIVKATELYYKNAEITLPARIYDRYKNEFSKSNRVTEGLTGLDLAECGYA